MKNGVKTIFMVALVVIFFVPINAFAQYRSQYPQYHPPYYPLYLAIKPGIYSPQSSDLDGFDTGFSGEVALGFRFNPNLAGEFGIGYFNTQDKYAFQGMLGGIPIAGEDNFDIDVTPITFTLKPTLPYQNLEFFGLVGVGAYIVSGELRERGVYGGSPYVIDAEDTKTVFGSFLGGGLNINLTPNLFIGFEGKYLWTDKVKLEDEYGIPLINKFNLNGYIIAGAIGFRF